MQLIEMITSGGHVQMLVIQQQALYRVRELIDAENERFTALSAQLRQ